MIEYKKLNRYGS